MDGCAAVNNASIPVITWRHEDPSCCVVFVDAVLSASKIVPSAAVGAASSSTGRRSTAAKSSTSNPSLYSNINDDISSDEHAEQAQSHGSRGTGRGALHFEYAILLRTGSCGSGGSGRDASPSSPYQYSVQIGRGNSHTETRVVKLEVCADILAALRQI